MIGFFPGKFQPPHLGHIMSIMDIYDNYEKIIIAITDDKPKILTLNERVDIFKIIFKHMKKIQIITLEDIIITKLEDDINLPKFDICISGNKDVLNKMTDLGYNVEFLDRSKGIGYSGTEIRTLI